MNNFDESNMITDIKYSKVVATMEDEDKIINDAHNSKFESTIEIMEGYAWKCIVLYFYHEFFASLINLFESLF